jgi:hypothetical protein
MSYNKKGGLERIRTAVGAFAELSLATRPRDHFCNKTIKNSLDYNYSKKRKGDQFGHLS